MDFIEWMTKKMQDLGYNRSHIHKDADLTIWFNFTDGTEDFNVCYVMKPIDPITIKGLFQNNDNKPILFIVDFDCIQLFGIGTVVTPLWIRALHAIYYGRIYMWDGSNIRARHYDWATKVSTISEPIDLDGILFTDTDCKLRDFPGIFHIARFYDKAFWKETEPQKPKGETWKERAKKGREEWEQATNGHAQGKDRKTDGDVYEAFKQAFKEYMRSRGVDYDSPRTRNNWPVGDKWLQGFMATGNLATARTLYKQLAKEWHPDLNPGKPDALATMQAINIAFDRVKDILR